MVSTRDAPSVRFPISFSNAGYALVPCGQWIDGIYTQNCGKTVTGFRVEIQVHHSAWLSGWIAMGY